MLSEIKDVSEAEKNADNISNTIKNANCSWADELAGSTKNHTPKIIKYNNKVFNPEINKLKQLSLPKDEKLLHCLNLISMLKIIT